MATLLIRNELILVDEIIINHLLQWKNNWFIGKFYDVKFPMRTERIHKKKISFLLSVEVTKFFGTYIEGMEVHHKNWDTLDNLEPVTKQQNCWMRRKRLDGFSPFIGICRFKGRFQCNIVNPNKERYYIGVFGNEIEAAIAYDLYALSYRGRYSVLNVLNHDFTLKEEYLEYQELYKRVVNRYRYDIKDKCGVTL